MLGKPPGVCHALGFHPLAIPQSSTRDVTFFSRALADCEIVGEIGLDYSRNSPDRARQRAVFDWIISRAGIDQKLLSIHSRGAESDIISALSGAGLSGVLHWYTGPLNLIDNALDAGLFFSINPAMLRTIKGKNLIQMLPRSRVLSESDGPFARVGRNPTAPMDVASVIDYLASAWNVSHDCARSIVWRNSVSMLSASTSKPLSAVKPEIPPTDL